MAEENKPTEDQEPKEEHSKRSFSKLLILGVLVIVLGAGGILGWNMFMKGSKTEAQMSEITSQNQEKEETASYPLDSFIVNLVDKTGTGKRYLKIGIILEICHQDKSIVLEKYKPQIRDTILLLLSSKSFRDISTMEGKLELKREILTRINQFLDDGIVSRIYFTEFVVQ